MDGAGESPAAAENKVAGHHLTTPHGRESM
jgi:hypothetical protein